jgi:hypothetical protein
LEGNICMVNYDVIATGNALTTGVKERKKESVGSTGLSKGNPEEISGPWAARGRMRDGERRESAAARRRGRPGTHRHTRNTRTRLPSPSRVLRQPPRRASASLSSRTKHKENRIHRIPAINRLRTQRTSTHYCSHAHNSIL